MDSGVGSEVFVEAGETWREVAVIPPAGLRPRWDHPLREPLLGGAICGPSGPVVITTPPEPAE